MTVLPRMRDMAGPVAARGWSLTARSRYCCGGTRVATDQPAVVLSWADISETCGTIAGQVTADGVPDVMVGIMRGGMIPAVLLAHALGCRDVRGVRDRTTRGRRERREGSPPGARQSRARRPCPGRDVLLVDDVAGTGAKPRPPLR